MPKGFTFVSKNWEEELLNLTSGAIECAIASAYMTPNSVDLLSRISVLLAESTKKYSQSKIRVILSDRFAPTSEKRLQILSKIRELPKVEVKIFCEKEFLHQKNYIFKTEDEIRVLVASANFTSSGFFRNLEWGTKSVHKPDDPEAIKMISHFETLWEKAKPVDEFIEVSLMNKEPKFHEGENVIYTTTRKIGTINKVIPGTRSFSYKVTISGEIRTISETFLERYIDEEENLIDDYYQGIFGDHKQYKIFQTWFRLSKPLEKNLYSYLGSKTLFNAHQFKPLLRFISPNSDERLFIADEVGVGKTIEAGIIINEMLARDRLNYHNTPILIVCPNSLCIKWKKEMKNRFRLDFEILNGPNLKYILESTKQDGVFPKKYLFSIVGLQLIRGETYLHLFEELDLKREGSTFGLVVIDEAHHMRNQETDSNAIGNLLSSMTDMMLMLSATPLNLRNEDLFNQMHILNPYLFSDKTAFETLYTPVIKINTIRRLLVEDTPKARQEIIIQFDELKKDPLGEIISKHQEINSLITRLNEAKKISSQEQVRYDRLLTELNPLFYSFTRSRKREALEHQVLRQVRELPITLSIRERKFQDDALKAVRDYYLTKGHDPQSLYFILNIFQRMITSCLPAMKEYFAWAIAEDRMLEITGTDYEEIEDDSQLSSTRLDPGVKSSFEALLKQYNDIDKTDSKYTQFKIMVGKILANPETPQIIIFSFFIRTLGYLKRRLESDGYKVGIIHGAVPLEGNQGQPGRYEIMEAFKRGEFDILLSSEVGGEGLDFQYCHAIVNYDLPYNPMRIEQRIGRIDRFGQEADKILVANLFIKGTIDEEIYDRLYRRIRLVEDGIGSFEPILGKEISDIQVALISGKLTEKEKNEKSKRLEEALQHAKLANEQLEQHKTELLSDDFLVKPLNNISKGEFISPQDTMDLTEQYLLQFEECSFSRLEDGCAEIKLSTDLVTKVEQFMRKPGNEGAYAELKDLTHTPKKIKVVFDGRLAESYPKYLFLPPTGFWAKFITYQFTQEKKLSKIFGFTANISDIKIPKGIYIVFLFEVRMEGLRTEIEFLGVPVDTASNKIIETDFESLPRILANIPAKSVETDYQDVDLNEVLAISRDYLDHIMEEKRKIASEENRFKVDSRIAALNESYNKKVNQIKLQLQKHVEKRKSEGKEPDERITRMRTAQVEKEKGKLQSKIQQLQQHQDLSLDYNLEAIVYLVVEGE